MDRDRLQAMILGCPFHRWLGIVVDAVDPADGSLTLGLPLRPEFSRSDTTTELHGGITAALIDIAGDYAVALSLGRGVPTIDLRVDYLRMGRGERVAATARALRVGRTVGTVDVDVHDATGALIAVGRGKYSTA
jgi:uncharacterized protein (TIGR00369 family)